MAKYPTDAAYQRATGSALALIGPRLRAQGKLVVANFGSWRVYRSAVTPWLKYVSGGMEEHFTKYAGDSPSRGLLHRRRLGQPARPPQGDPGHREAVPRHLATRTARDRAAARYGWATMLLAANGTASFALHENYTRETWFPEYGYDLGAPRGKESELAGGIHRRAFERGLVLVNPTKASVAVRFGGRYRGSGLRAARSAVMRPHTGLVLLAVNPKRSREAEQQAPPPPRRPSLSARSRRLPSSRPPVPAARSPSRSAHRAGASWSVTAASSCIAPPVCASASAPRATPPLKRGRHLKIVIRARR